MFRTKNFITVARKITAATVLTLAPVGLAHAAPGDVGTVGLNETEVTISAPALYRISNVPPFSFTDQDEIANKLRDDLPLEQTFGICVWTNDFAADDIQLRFSSSMGPDFASGDGVFAMVGDHNDDPVIRYEVAFDAAVPTTLVDIAADGDNAGISEEFPADSITNQASTDCGGNTNHNVRIRITSEQLRLLYPGVDYQDTLQMELRAF